MLMVALLALSTAAIAGDVKADGAVAERKPPIALEETRPVPEPMAYALLGASFFGLGLYAKKKNRGRI